MTNINLDNNKNLNRAKELVEKIYPMMYELGTVIADIWMDDEISRESRHAISDVQAENFSYEYNLEQLKEALEKAEPNPLYEEDMEKQAYLDYLDELDSEETYEDYWDDWEDEEDLDSYENIEEEKLEELLDEEYLEETEKENYINTHEYHIILVLRTIGVNLTYQQAKEFLDEAEDREIIITKIYGSEDVSDQTRDIWNQYPTIKEHMISLSNKNESVIDAINSISDENQTLSDILMERFSLINTNQRKNWVKVLLEKYIQLLM